MKVRAILAVTAALMLLLGGTTPASATYTPADGNSCQIELNNPHISFAAPGVIAKAKWRCNDTSPNKSIYYVLYLYRCPTSFVVEAYAWLDEHCTLEGYDFDFAMPITQDGEPGSKTRYVPPSSLPGAAGSGWWIAEAIWISSHADGSNDSDQHVRFSLVKHLTYP